MKATCKSGRIGTLSRNCIREARATSTTLPSPLRATLRRTVVALACLLIGQLNRDGGTTFGEREAALLSVLRTERLARVRADALTAFGHLRTGFGDENTERFRADAEIVRFVTDPDANVRGSLAFALAGTATPEGIAAELALMHDPRSTRARDWSTTSVGWMTAVDAPHVRAALLLRADDRDEIVRAEAMHGLARRRDARVVPLIIRELDGYDGHKAGLIIAAACEFLYGDETVERTVDEVLAELRAARTPTLNLLQSSLERRRNERRKTR